MHQEQDCNVKPVIVFFGKKDYNQCVFIIIIKKHVDYLTYFLIVEDSQL